MNLINGKVDLKPARSGAKQITVPKVLAHIPALDFVSPSPCRARSKKLKRIV